MPKITHLGDMGLFWIVLGIVFLFGKKYRKGGIMLLIALAMGAVVGNIILKPLIARPRPCHIYTDISLLIAVPVDFSFPSGHTVASFTAAYIITYINRKFGYFAIPLAILIAFSRLYLYVHFPSDVICGAVFGVLFAAAVIKIFKYKLHSL